MQSDDQLAGFHLCPMIAEPLRQAETENFGVESDRTIHIGHEDRGDPFCNVTGATGASRTNTDLPDVFCPVTTQRISIKPLS